MAAADGRGGGGGGPACKIRSETLVWEALCVVVFSRAAERVAKGGDFYLSFLAIVLWYAGRAVEHSYLESLEGLDQCSAVLRYLKQLEFAVQMTCQNCVEAIQSSLQDVPGLQVLDIQLDNQSVLVETTLSTETVQSRLESTGRKAVLKGMGGTGSQGSAAVAMVSGPGLVQGVVRFLQVTPENCLIDGTIDGLQPGLHGLHIHEFGDVTNACNSCGDHFNPSGECHGGPEDLQRHAGDLGNILVAPDGRAAFRMEDQRLKVHEIIGRSLVVDEGEDDLGRGNHPLSKVTGNSGERVACGIIARSPGLFQNPKKICTCDGVTLWEERKRPVAKTGQSVASHPSPHL